ncbi:hypothetical protein EW145_g937 [Phellinidium pouzarii]|uniref:thioredoxin-dependent peroxiredoxin n=1 Tax=Phellinidium pouzarii TaxID=167371 RepID=A0A4S4LGN7_9AGAM|nr:hypothetical protein EW145_g937 [Phellinidium pouzarii]
MPKHSLIGKRAPEISLPNSDGTTYTFTPGASGGPTVIFFYPQSGSYGCTKEACQFRDSLSEEGVFKATNVQVIGVSPDPVEKQKKFVEKQNLTYPVLSDVKGEARKAYNVSKGLMGLTPSSRITFVIDAEGVVKDALDTTINYAAHHEFVQNWLKGTSALAPAAAEPSPTSGEAAAAPTQDANANSVASMATAIDPAIAAPVPAVPVAPTVA